MKAVGDGVSFAVPDALRNTRNKTGKSGAHANQKAKESAARQEEAARAEYDKLKSKPNKTKEDKAAEKKAEKQLKHLQKKQRKVVKHIGGKENKKGHIFTFVMEFREGTYIQQVGAPNLKSSLVYWAEHLNVYEIKHMGHQSKKELLNCIYADDPIDAPVLLDGLVNVWHVYYSIAKGSIFLNIIKTDGSASDG